MADLGERKQKILQAIIEDYISTAEPIGSRTIAKKSQLGISSATIRNEMADLEEMGFLLQPHTSSGRIPSDAAYRYYVNELITSYRINSENLARITEAFSVGLNQLDSIIKRASEVMSYLTDYVTVVAMPQLSKSYIKQFEAFLIDPYSVVVVLVTNNSIARNQIIHTKVAMDVNLVHMLSSVLNSRFAGLSMEQISLAKINSAQMVLKEHSEILMPIVDFIIQTIGEMADTDIYFSGTTNMLSQPEFNDINKAKELVSFLEDRTRLKNMVSSTRETDKINIIIGSENKLDVIKDCSILTAKYSIGDNVSGTLSVIGPTRMNYSSVLESLDCISFQIDKIINDLYDNDG